MLHLLDPSACSGDRRLCLETARYILCPVLIVRILQHVRYRLTEPGVGELIAGHHPGNPKLFGAGSHPRLIAAPGHQHHRNPIPQCLHDRAMARVTEQQPAALKDRECGT